MTAKTALIMIDLQKDFCFGGSLAVPDADSIIPLVNQIQKHFSRVLASKDWHPGHHSCFASSHPGHVAGEVMMVNNLVQTLWPEHCLQESVGAEFHDDLETGRIEKIIYKGTDQQVHSYSAFYDDARIRQTELEAYLHEHHIKDLYILGLATDFCVRFSALDALQAGFNVYVIRDACRGIDFKPGDSELAFEEMRAAGAHIITSSEINHESIS